jgi:hypothetical protein
VEVRPNVTVPAGKLRGTPTILRQSTDPRHKRAANRYLTTRLGDCAGSFAAALGFRVEIGIEARPPAGETRSQASPHAQGHPVVLPPKSDTDYARAREQD